MAGGFLWHQDAKCFGRNAERESGHGAPPGGRGLPGAGGGVEPMEGPS